MNKTKIMLMGMLFPLFFSCESMESGLEQTSTETVEETNTMEQDAQEESDSSFSVIGDFVEAIEETTEAINEVGKAINEVSEGVGEAAKSINEVGKEIHKSAKEVKESFEIPEENTQEVE